MNKEFYMMFRKNLKILVNNRLSFFILFLGPIILLSLMTLMYYNENSYSFQIGVVSDEKNFIYDRLTEELDNNGFLVVEYDFSENCIIGIQEARVQGCILFPTNLQIGEEAEVRVLIDNSKTQVKEVVENILRTTLNGGRYLLSYELIEFIVLELESLELQLGDIIKENRLNQEEYNEIKDLLDEIKFLSLKADLAFNPGALGVDDIDARISTIKNNKLKLISNSVSAINNSLNYSYALENSIRDSNLSSGEISTLRSYTSGLKDNLYEAKLRVESYGGASFTLDTLVSDIEDLVEELEDAEKELDASFSDQQNYLETNVETLEDLSSTLSQRELSINSSLNSSSTLLRDPHKILSPVDLTFENAFKSENSKLSSLFPMIFGTLILILSLFLGSVLSFKEKTSQSRIRNVLISPSAIKEVIAQVLSVVVLLYIQLCVIAILFYVVFIKSFYIDLLLILILLFLFLIVFVLIGILIGQLARSQMSLVLFLLFVLFVLFLTSGVILPLELLDGFLVSFLQNTNPYLAMENILRKLLLFSVPFSSLVSEIVILFGVFIVFLGITIILNSYSKRSALYYFLHRKR